MTRLRRLSGVASNATAIPLRQEATELMLMLEKLEVAVRVCTPNCVLDQSASGEVSNDDGEEDEVCRLKFRAYQRALRDRLETWDGLNEATAECLRSRIEDLGPCLNRSLEVMRTSRAALRNPQPPVQSSPAVPASNMAACAVGGEKPGIFDLAPTPEAILSRTAVCEDTKVGSDVVESTLEAIPPSIDARQSNSGSFESRFGQRKGKSQASKAGGYTGKTGGARAQLESEMVDLAEGMKGCAGQFLETLRKDNRRLDAMGADATKSLDKVKAETKKGKDLIWKGQLSFMCTMIMLAVSVVIFFMMIPFIIFT